MSMIKRLLEECLDKGICPEDYDNLAQKTVCSICINQPEIAAFISENTTCNHCSYCRSESEQTTAIQLLKIADYIREAIEDEYSQPVEILYYEDGEYFGPQITTSDILDEEAVSIENDDLRYDIISAIGHDLWCPKEGLGETPHEALSFGWQAFCELVKHECRYVFLNYTDDSHYISASEIPPHQFLDELGKVINHHNIYTNLVKGKKVFRIRPLKDGDAFEPCAAELGPPPVKFCNQANRMSPSGIPMFYGAEAQDTCVAEVSIERGNKAIIGEFEITEDIVLLDLTNLPPVPTIFQEDRLTRHGLHFLRDFEKDFTKPINNSPEIEYVPTQIVAEYVRQILHSPRNQKISGIIYSSSKNRKPAYVLFINQNHVADPGKVTKDTKMILTTAYAIEA
jgi:hypothetical protein